MKPTRPHRRHLPLRTRFALHRRGVAAVCAFLAVLALAMVLSPTQPGVTVVAAARALPSGTQLAARDLTTLRVPPEAVPVGARADPAELVGQTLSASLAARGILTPEHTAPVSAQAAPGNLVVALQLPSSGVGALVTAGSRLDLFASDGSVVATQVRVLRTPGDEARGLASGGRSALIEVSVEVAGVLARHRHADDLVIALR